MNEKHLEELIKQQKKTNSLLEEILKELRKDDISEDASISENSDSSIPELLDREKNQPFAHVVKNGYVYTFCYGKFLECKQARGQDLYMYRDASAKYGD